MKRYFIYLLIIIAFLALGNYVQGITIGPVPSCIDDPSDEEVMTWESDNSACEWQPGGGGGGGSPVILDLADDASNESVDIVEIATTGDTNSIFTEPSGDKLLIDVGQNWPICDAAATGDSATSFFPAGTIEHERGGLEANVSGYAGLIRINAGITMNVTDLAGLNTAIGSSISDGAHTTDTSANTECAGTTTYLDGEGNCDDISSVYEPAGITAADISDLNGGTDITADLEEEAHVSEHQENGADELLGETLGTACTVNQILKSDGLGGLDCAADATGGSPTFTTISSGTNVTATMTVGTGASLGTSGSGAISATDLEGTDFGTLTDTKYCTYDLAATEIDCNSDGGGAETNSLETVMTGVLVDEVPVGTSADTATYKAIADCDGLGNAVNYDTTTHAFSCKTLVDDDIPDTVTASNYFPLSGGATITGNATFDDDTGDSPSVTFTNQANTSFSVLKSNSPDQLNIVSNTANTEKVYIGNSGGGIANLEIEGGLTIGNQLHSTEGSTVQLTSGSIDPTASINVVGVGTVFTTDLKVGYRLLVTGETRTVVKITDDTHLTVDTAYSDNANDIAPDYIPSNILVTDGGTPVTAINEAGLYTKEGYWFKSKSATGNGANMMVSTGLPSTDTSLTTDAYTHGGNNVFICSDDTTGASLACGVFIADRDNSAGQGSSWNQGIHAQFNWSDGNMTDSGDASAIRAKFNVPSVNNGTHTMYDATGIEVTGARVPSSDATADTWTGVHVQDFSSTGDFATTCYGTKIETQTACTTNYELYTGSGEMYVTDAGEMVATEMRSKSIPSNQSITDETTTITADACGGFKKITSSSDVRTSTTTTIETPSAANAGCVMFIFNIGAYIITLDGNANFNNSVDYVLPSYSGAQVTNTGAGGAWFVVGGKDLYYGVQTAITDITSTQILALHTTPVDISPTPPANYLIQPISLYLYFDYGSVAYSSVGANDELRVFIQNNGTNLFYSSDAEDSDGSGVNNDRIETEGMLDIGSGYKFTKPFFSDTALEYGIGSSAHARPIQISLDGQVTTGDGTLRAILTYQTVKTTPN